MLLELTPYHDGPGAGGLWVNSDRITLVVRDRNDPATYVYFTTDMQDEGKRYVTVIETPSEIAATINSTAAVPQP
jgi:hypothetical protein